MFTSARKLQANLENAKKSTGPQSEASKAKVAQNRTVHGLTGQFHVLEGENEEKFDQLVAQLIIDEKPVGIAEIELVKKMAQHMWLSQRSSRFQEACFVVMPRTQEQRDNLQAAIVVRPELERYTRYQAHHNREYARASGELLKRRKERRLEGIGFESQKCAQAEENRRQELHPIRVERAKTAVALDKARVETIQPGNLVKGMAAAAQMDGPVGPLEDKIAA